MSDEDIQKARAICSEVIEEKVQRFTTTLKWCGYVAGLMVLVLIPGWFFADGKAVYRSLHSAAFPLTFKKDTVLITAYTKDFILKVDEENKYAYLKFYAEKGQQVRYLLTIDHQFLGTGALQKFFILVDDDRHSKSSIQTFAGDFKKLKINFELENDNPEIPSNIHKIAFEIDKKQVDVNPKQTIFITCIIHVYGKQYEL